MISAAPWGSRRYVLFCRRDDRAHIEIESRAGSIPACRYALGYSPVVALITARTSVTVSHGNPPQRACSRTASGFGATYTQ